MGKIVASINPEYGSKEYLDREFQRDYGFNKPLPARCPVDSTYKYDSMKNDLVRNEKEQFYSKKERDFVLGTPAKFKGRRTGSIYSKKK